MRRLQLVVLVLFVVTTQVTADNWPQWRGPHGSGVSSDTGLPMRWSGDENVAWTSRLGGLGVSTPIAWGDRIFVTSQAGRGVVAGGNHPTLSRGEERGSERALGGGATRGGGDTGSGGVDFLVEAFALADGARLWQYRLPAVAPLPPVHSKHNLASPSPATDGQRVYAWFGTGQLVALDMDGTLVWQRHLGKEYSPFDINWGHSSSPTVYGDLLILLCHHDPASILLALDARTGEERWKVDRGRGVTSYSTPLVIRGGDRDELIVNSSERIDAYDPATGRLLWYAGESNRFPIPVPSHDEGVVYMSRGYRSGPYMAIRTGGSGDVTTTHVQWRVGSGAPYVSSLVYYEGLVYMVSDAGVVSCVDGATGEKIWQHRVGGVFSASPVAGDGKIYFLEEGGETVVMAAGREPKILARNRLDVRTISSPAIVDGQLLVRADDQLICIGKRPAS